MHLTSNKPYFPHFLIRLRLISLSLPYREKSSLDVLLGTVPLLVLEGIMLDLALEKFYHYIHGHCI
jgi:hypothetical protein